ncbi:MAG: hypothetical protein ACRDEA_15260 [Microcystaceae cyanobacterium]
MVSSIGLVGCSTSAPVTSKPELRGGRATELGLQVGDHITIEFRQ